MEKTTNNIIEMLNNLNNSLNMLTRRIDMLEDRQYMSRPMQINPYLNNNPIQMSGFKPNEMYGLHGSIPRSPYGSGPGRPYSTTNTQNHINATRHTQHQQPHMYNNNNGYSRYNGGPIDYIPINYMTVDNIINVLTNRYNINLTEFEKHALNKLKTLENIPLDIHNHVTILQLHVTQYMSSPEVFIPILKSIINMMCAEGYIDAECKIGETVSSVENINRVNQNLDIIKTIMSAKERLLILPSYAPSYAPDNELNKCVDTLNNYLISIHSQINTAKEVTQKHITCNHLANELLKLLDSYNVPNTYKFGMYINNIDKLTVDLNKLIKDYNIITTHNPTNEPVVNKHKKHHVRRR